MLGKAPASAKAKLGKAKPSKDAGKLGKVGKEALGKGKRKLAPRISDVSLDSEGFPGMFSSPSKKVPKKFTLCIRFQLGNSFVNTKVPKKFTLCICFQLGNSFANTKVEKNHFMYSFSSRHWVSPSFAWQTWDNVHCQGVGCTPWGSSGLGLRQFCVAGVGQCALPRGRMYALGFRWRPWVSASFAWQAWGNLEARGRL